MRLRETESQIETQCFSVISGRCAKFLLKKSWHVACNSKFIDASRETHTIRTSNAAHES